MAIGDDRISPNTRSSDFMEAFCARLARVRSGIVERIGKRERQNEVPFCFILSLFKKKTLRKNHGGTEDTEKQSEGTLIGADRHSSDPNDRR
jgi:hypothetical protein